MYVNGLKKSVGGSTVHDDFCYCSIRNINKCLCQYQYCQYCIVSGARGVISRGPNATSQPGAQNDTRNDIRPYIAPNQPYKTIETTVYL